MVVAVYGGENSGGRSTASGNLCLCIDFLIVLIPWIIVEGHVYVIDITIGKTQKGSSVIVEWRKGKLMFDRLPTLTALQSWRNPRPRLAPSTSRSSCGS